MTKRRLGKALDRLDSTKKTRDRYIPGVLGINLNGNQTVEVPNREGFVYVKLRNNTSEIIQAFNGGTVSPVFNLPVLVFRDEIDRTRYRIHGRDTAQYQNWGTAAYLGKHGNSHSFAPERGGGGDIVWVYDRQFVPLHIHPSGSVGSENVIIEEDVYYWEGNWRYAGNTGTPNLVSLKPTDSQARLMLIYLDDNSNPAIATGTFFDGTITGTSQIIPYLPSLPSTQGVPLGAVRLVSGTERILWGNIYDLRPLIVGDGFIPTGTYGRTILDDGSPLTNRGALNFVGDFFTIYDDPINEHTIISGSSYNDQFVNITGDTMTGALLVQLGSSGASASIDGITVENNANVAINILTPDVNVGYLIFGSPSDNTGALINWNYGDLDLRINTAVAGGRIIWGTDVGTDVLILDANQNAEFVGNVDIGGYLELTTSQNEFVSGTQPSIYRTTSTGASYPFTEVGHLIIQPNTSLQRDIVFATYDGSSIDSRVVIDSDGQVGIGISSPDGTLHVHTASAGSVTAHANADSLVVENNTTGGISVLIPDNSSGLFNIGSPSQNRVASFVGNYNSGTPRAAIQTAGTNRVLIESGVQVGSPTGGDKGAGTINTAGDIYKNNSAYTNPDYVFEKAYTGSIVEYAKSPGADAYKEWTLSEIESFVKENFYLPWIDRSPSGIFKRGDTLLETIERIYLHLFEINRKIK